MSEELIEASTSAPALPFRWRDAGGNYHAPESMETRHLFYTLRMIWNHSMPEVWRIQPFRLYRFQPFYTEEYMRSAITAIGKELLSRPDLLPSWKAQIDFMASRFASMKPQLTTEAA